MGFVKGREAVGQWGWNKELTGKEQTIDDLKFGNYVKEIYMDSDTKVALLSNSPSDVPQDWFIPQDAGVQDPRDGQQAGRHARGCWRISRSPRARTAGSTRSTRRSRSTSRIRGRATRSATTRTRSSPRIRGTPTTKS